MASSDESNRLIQTRRAKLDGIRASGGPAYPNRFRVTATAGSCGRATRGTAEIAAAGRAPAWPGDRGAPRHGR
jgi:hypothetical protein